MKGLSLGLSLLLTAVSAVHAVPSSELQHVFANIAEYADAATGGLFGTVAKGMNNAIGEIANIAEEEIRWNEGAAEKWVDGLGREMIKQNGLTYELITHPAFADHSLRTTDPELCDPSVKQHSGYLDITDGKHLFFWFFESRGSPSTDPLVLWLNGGPGGSSSIGLLMELGPCRVSDEGKNTTVNPHAWNNNANIIFLDQPVNVGYSYSSNGSKVKTTPVAGEDVYAFLELFLARYPEYSELPFHLAAESYGGRYAPVIASTVFKHNKELEAAVTPTPGVVPINLASVVLANGLTNPLIQMASVPDYACEGPYPVYDDPEGAECQALRTKVPTCERLINSCYSFDSRLTCVPAALYCEEQLFGPLQKLGLNVYDVRKKCDKSKDGDLCYREMSWIDTWMNETKHKEALGVDPNRKFTSVNMEVNQDFMLQGDGMHNSALLLPDLINDGIRLLVYAGNADLMCNSIGNERWVEDLEHKFHKEFVAAKSKLWMSDATGRIAGEVRVAGKGAGSVTFVQVYEAGHMVPFDQPEHALDLFERWTSNETFF
ncbi:hypothetical protein PENSPDRAFT_646398 [Peniophora sp. CONT]|nr:hypothetical protein PENSPDRAFT_646398 [Peniophora sp. CONT]